MFEELARLLVRWQAKLKNWHAVWHIGTPYRTLARWHIKMRCFHAFGTLARRHINHAGTQACWHVTIHVRKRIDKRARDLANS